MTPEEIEQLSNSVSVLDYFQDLERRGKVRFDQRRGHDYYFLTDANKFSVTDEKYYDFKAGTGGRIIKAVMEMENKNWREAVDFLKDFSNTYIVSEVVAEKKQTEKNIVTPQSTLSLVTTPNNEKLIAYFEERGISREVLQQNTQQVHYQNQGKNYFGIGIKNQSGGYDVRNAYIKAKVGHSDITFIQGSKNELVVFEGMTDMLSYLQLCKENNRKNTRSLVVLNSITNTGKFIEQFQNYQGTINLILDGDKAGNEATEKIKNALPNSIDQRAKYDIYENENNDLNDYLKNKKNKISEDIVLQKGMKAVHKDSKNEFTIQYFNEKSIDLKYNYAPYLSRVNSIPFNDIKELFNHYDFYDFNNKLIDVSEKKRIFTENFYNKNIENEQDRNQSNRVSSPEPMGGKSPERDHRETDPTSQSQQERNNTSRQTMDGNNVGNGLESAERSDLGGRTGRTQMGENLRTQQEVLPTVGSDGNRSQPSGTRTTSGSDTGSSPTTGDRAQEETPLPIGSREERGENTQNIPHRDRPRSEGNSSTNSYGTYRPTTLEKNPLLNKKVSNEQIQDLVNSLTFISEDKTIQFKEGVNITDDIKNIVQQYKSGGITKDGRGVLDEYYTDEKLVNAVQNLIKDNFKGKSSINILEPSVGTGNFLHVTTHLGIKTTISAFEINETTAKIAKILHPNAEINLRSFETEFITDRGFKKDFETDKYDLVIGNPPYGSHRGEYIGLGEEPKLTKYEDYFVKRSLDVMKEGATLAMVLPSGWLNRQKNLSNAELTEAYRLPNGAFKATNVGTDIIILKKNSQTQNQDISNFFKENPNNVLGDTIMEKNRFGREEEYIKGSLEDAIFRLENHKNTIKKVNPQEVIQLTLDDLLKEQDKSTKNEEKTTKLPVNTSNEEEKKKELLLNTQNKVQNALNSLENIKFKSLSILKEIEKYLDLKIKLNNASTFTKEELEEIAQKADNIVQLHIKKKEPKEKSEYVIQNEPNISKKILKYQFVKDDIVINTSNQNNPNLTQEQIKAFSDTNYDGQLFTNDENIRKKYGNLYKGMIIHDFYYAEGNIYEKLEQLVKDFTREKIKKGEYDKTQYEKQKKLLESVLPPKKELEDIVISPNHEFVHKFLLGKVEKQHYNKHMGRYDTITKDYSLAEKFKDFTRELPSQALEPSSSWEVNNFVDNEIVTGSDKERNALVRERRKEVANKLFQKFLKEELTSEEKEKFVYEFNRKYNNIHIPDYSKFPLFSKINQNFKGTPLQLTEVQKAGIGRLTTKGVGLLAHEVGFGKTLSGVLSMHEAMERGNAKRPLIVVPNDNILKQWVETIYETIPNAKVNVLGNLGKDYDLSHFNNKDGEITLVTYEGFNNIGFNKEITQNQSIKFSYINEKDLDSLDSPTQREIEKQIAEINKIQGKMKRGKVYDWEDFDFDHLTFDEVHNANHIVDKVRLEDKRFASDFRNQNQRASKLGLNTWVASQYIQQKYNGRNVTLLSATPFTNKPLEYYSILSLIANQRLESSGYFNVNNFFETFMEADNDMEIDAKGDVKFKTNVRRFKNNALFQQLLSEFIDIKGEEDNPQLVRPNRINKEYKIEQNKLTEEMYGKLDLFFDENKDGAILTHILNARKIAISPYLYEDYDGKKPTTKEFIENSPKLKMTMDLIQQNKADKPEAGQIIYSELGVSEFPKFKEYLVEEVGYNENEVRIITGATSKAQRLDIQEKFNEGKIKIIIGSEAIQEGMNLQENTSDMYLLTLPYNFTSLRQIEGRMWRQGNKWENVRMNYMLTNDSIDVFMLQKLQVKQARYMESIKKGASIIDVSDVDAQELKTAIITDPYTRAKIEIELQKAKLQKEISKHNSDLGFISRKYQEYNEVFKDFLKEKKSYENMQQWAETDSYWKDRLPMQKTKMDRAKKEVDMVTEKMMEKGVNILEFKKQQERTQATIENLEKQIKEELPIIENNLIIQYKTEKAERLKTNQIDYIKERAEENKTFYKLRPKEDKKVGEIAENKNISISQEQEDKKSFGRKR